MWRRAMGSQSGRGTCFALFQALTGRHGRGHGLRGERADPQTGLFDTDRPTVSSRSLSTLLTPYATTIR